MGNLGGEVTTVLKLLKWWATVITFELPEEFKTETGLVGIGDRIFLGVNNTLPLAGEIMGPGYTEVLGDRVF